LTEWRVALTCDVDLVDHVTGDAFETELHEALPRILDVLDRHPPWTATWFVRIDAQLEAAYGSATLVFDRHADLIAELRRRGHEIGWHPHCYVKADDGWTPNVDPSGILADLRRHAPAAHALGLTSVRMGWACHTNESMRWLADEQFTIDSSAMPRPRYPWDTMPLRDWATTPLTAYRPSRADYRVPGTPALDIVEIPISMAVLPVPGDTQPVVRYFNPAFHPALLVDPLRSWFETHDALVLITHPYELLPQGWSHPALAGSVTALDANLSAIERLADERDVVLRPLALTQFAPGLTA